MSAPPLSPLAFADWLEALAGDRPRVIVALAGPPGAGKSTLADAVAERLEARRAGFCAVLAMDGFHYDDLLLGPLGWRARKGAPHTFDAGGLAATLRRLRAADEATVAVPVFDRGLEIARAGARLIRRETPLVLVEGNYLLLDEEPWRGLRPFFDGAAMIRVSAGAVEARLRARWAGFGLGPEAIAAKVGANDLPNARRVMEGSAAPDVWVDGEGG